MMRRTIQVDGASIQVLDNGGSGPTVVFAHGNSSAGDAFVPLMEALGRDVRAIAVDFYGHGGSPLGAESPCHLQGYVSLLREVVRALGAEPCVLVGHSMGGHAVLETLPVLNGEVKAAVLLSSPPFNVATIGDVFRDPTEGLLFKAELTPQETQRLADAFASPDNLPADGRQAIVDRIAATDHGVRPRIGQALATGGFGDEVAMCREARCPLVFVQGQRDPFINVAYYDTLALDARKDRVVRIDGVRHSPHLEAVEKVREVVASCLG